MVSLSRNTPQKACRSFHEPIFNRSDGNIQVDYDDDEENGIGEDGRTQTEKESDSVLMETERAATPSFMGKAVSATITWLIFPHSGEDGSSNEGCTYSLPRCRAHPLQNLLKFWCYCSHL